MKQSQMSTNESNGSKNQNLDLEKNQKKSSKKDPKPEYEKNQFKYEDKLHQQHQNAIHAIFASTIF
jgi:hypothetical protein